MNELALRSTALVDLVEGAAITRREVRIPNDTLLRIRLDTNISTKTSRENDRFKTTLLELRAYGAAIIKGHIVSLKRSGQLTGRSETRLKFDMIKLRNGRQCQLAAQLERVYESEKVKSIDEEGNIETAGKGNETAVRAAGGGMIGGVIGSIAGGGKGAAIGALIGTGSVFIQGNKDLVFDPGIEMGIRTSALINQASAGR